MGWEQARDGWAQTTVAHLNLQWQFNGHDIRYQPSPAVTSRLSNIGFSQGMPTACIVMLLHRSQAPLSSQAAARTVTAGSINLQCLTLHLHMSVLLMCVCIPTEAAQGLQDRAHPC